MGNIKDTLNQIFEIIRFPSDQRGTAISGILDLINEYTLVSLLRRLDKEVQLEFKELIRDKEEQREYIITFIEKYYTTEAVKRTVEEEAKKLICDYLKTLSPMINDDEKEKIRALLKDCF